MAECISPSELNAIKEKRLKKKKSVSNWSRNREGNNQQQVVHGQLTKEGCCEWVDSEIQDIRFSFSSSSPQDMDQDPPWCVSEWSPERDEDVNELESSSPSKCCRPQMKEEADDYSEEFFLWNIDLEQKYHPKESLSNQPQVKDDNRSALVAWLSRVTRSYEFYQETLFLAVNVLDRFLCLTPIALECFQLLGISALFIAAKQLEVYHPTLTDLLTLCPGIYNKQHLQQMEKIILRQLKFNLVVPTCLFFLEYFTCHIQPSNNNNNNEGGGAAMFQKRPYRQMVRNLSELCIQDYGLCQYTPSVMAIASMAVIEEFINGKPTELLYERHCLQSLSLSVIKECTTEIWRYLPKVMLERPMMDLSRDDFFEYLPMQTG